MTILLYASVEILAICFFYMGMKEKRYGRNLRKILVTLSFMVLFLIIVFRDLDVGTDYLTYYNAINRIQNGTASAIDKQWLSSGFVALIRILSFFNIPETIVPFITIGIIAFITLFCFYKVFMELSSYPTYSMFIFLSFCLYFQLMNQFRQMLAIALTFFAYKYINKSFFKYCLFVIIGALFHSSAFIMLPFYFIVKIKINYKVIIMYIIAMTIALFSYDTIEKLLRTTTYGSTYLGWESFDTSFSTSAILNLFVRIALLIISLGVYKKLSLSDNNKYQPLYHMIIVCTILQCFTVVSYLFGRVTTYFFVYYIILLPDVIKTYRLKIANNSKQIYDFMVIILFIAYQLVYYLFQGASSAGYGDYSFIFA